MAKIKIIVRWLSVVVAIILWVIDSITEFPNIQEIVNKDMEQDIPTDRAGNQDKNAPDAKRANRKQGKGSDGDLQT